MIDIFYQLTIFAKSSIVDVRLSFKHASDLEPRQTSMIEHFAKIFHG